MAKLNDDASCIVGSVDRPIFRLGAFPIGCGGHLAVGHDFATSGENTQKDWWSAGCLPEFDGCPRFESDRFTLGYRLVGGVFFGEVRILRESGRGSVVVELVYLHPCGQIRHSAEMICMVMGDDEMVDGLDSGLLHCRLDPRGIATTVCRPTSVDQNRFPSRSDDQRRGAAFDIDIIYFKLACRRRTLLGDRLISQRG